MGGAPSTGQNNDELVEYLVQSGYVHRKEVELVFGAVDRADYVLSSHQETAYHDLAWKYGNLHLSAPCVYGVAMEFLSLKPGQSFLNIGSGTGYFSTMAGLLLGPYGVNHGIELHGDCVQYARGRLENFKQNSTALEEFEFCEPSFVEGNCLRVVPSREYDKVYCGAAVSDNDVVALKRFVRTGGSIVMPYKGRLCCFRRNSDNVWTCKKSLGVSFATLIIPDNTDQTSITLPDSEPLSLQELCRSKVRQILREKVWIDHPELEKRNLTSPNPDSQSDPYFDKSYDGISEDDDEEEEDEEEDEDEEEEDEDETEGHIFRRTRFLFNMEVDANEATNTPLQLRRVAMLVHRRTGPDAQRIGTLLNRIIEETRNAEPPRAAGSASSLEQDGSSNSVENQSVEASLNPVLDPSNESQDWHSNRTRPPLARKANDSEDSDIDSDEDGEHLSKWKKIPKRENTDSGIVDDVNIAYDDTSSSPNAEQSDSDGDDDMDVDLSGVALGETFRHVYGRNNQDSVNNTLSDSRNEDLSQTASAQSRLFVSYMKEKIELLPLPTALKLYINHNRTL